MFQKKMNSRLLFDGNQRTAAVTKHIFHNMKQTLLADNVRGGFTQLGLSCDIAASPCILVFDENVLRQSAEFPALWHQECPQENLSVRRRNATFGWINKMMRVGWNDEE
jgi:hypothetical protein